MKAILVGGLGFGDEGKGSVVDYLTRVHKAGLVVRFNGGAQAAHNVVTDEGLHHTFSQFGSGTLAGARTHLSRFVAVSPEHFFNEAHHLRTACGIPCPEQLITVSPSCLVTTRFHALANRIREKARHTPHGSCGVGFGETIDLALQQPAWALRAAHLTRGPAFIEEIIEQQWMLLQASLPDTMINGSDSYRAMKTVVAECVRFGSTVRLLDDAELGDRMKLTGTTIFEGAQGVLLDETHGFQPHTTWSTCTLANARKLLEGVDAEVESIGVTRSFLTRHGAGPMPTYYLDFAQLFAPDDHNRSDGFQGLFRAGPLDLVLLNYALTHDTYDSLAVTHADKINEAWPIAVAYSLTDPLPGLSTEALWRSAPVFMTHVGEASFLAHLARASGVPISIVSRGPRPSDKEFIP